MIPTSGVTPMAIYTKHLHLAILLRSVMPTSGIIKFLYDDVQIGPWTTPQFISYSLDNSTKKYDTNKWC